MLFVYRGFGDVGVVTVVVSFLDSSGEKFVEVLGSGVFVVGAVGSGDPKCKLDRVVDFEVVGALDIKAGDVVLGSSVGKDVVAASPIFGVVAQASGLVSGGSPHGGLVAEVVPLVGVKGDLQCVDVRRVGVEIRRYDGRSFGVGSEFDEGIGDQVVSLVGDGFVTRLASACEGIDGKDV